MHILKDNLSSCVLARDTYLNSSCGINRSLIFKIKNRWNASVIHYMAKPVIQNKEMAKFETKSSYKKNIKKVETNPSSFKSDLKSTIEYIEYYWSCDLTTHSVHSNKLLIIYYLWVLLLNFNCLVLDNWYPNLKNK